MTSGQPPENELEQIERRIQEGFRMVSVGECAEALVVARKLLADHSKGAVRFNCAGILIDAGERLDDEAAVRHGVALLDELYEKAAYREKLGETLLYNRANGRASLIHMANRRLPRPNYRMRTCSEEEEVVRLYFDGSVRLMEGKPEFAINCACMLRVQARLYEAIDVLDFTLASNPEHPNAHLHMGNTLWAAGMACRARDGAPESLFVAALWHLRLAAKLFSDGDEPSFAAASTESAVRLEDVIRTGLGVDPDAAIQEIGSLRLGPGQRLGVPLGMTLLARSPYRDEDDPALLDHLPDAVHEFFSDAAGTFAMGREILGNLELTETAKPRWGARTPDLEKQAIHAAVRQFWSVLEKVGWTINAHFQVGLDDRRCSFANVFGSPDKDALKRLQVVPSATKLERHPNLEGDNPGLLALSTIAASLRGSVYGPLKRLRDGAEHRSPSPTATVNDAAMLLGIARAAVLHAADAVMHDQFQRPIANPQG